jgi:uncharacterized protein (TIGR03437 family)
MRYFLASVMFVSAAFAQSGTPLITAVSNYLDYRSSLGLAPGSSADVTVTGVNLGPLTLGGAPGLSVFVNGIQCVVQFSQGNTFQSDIVFTIPFEVPVGSASLVVQYQTARSTAFTLQLAPYAPAIQLYASTGLAYTLPVPPGGAVNITATGLGQSNPPVPTGQPVPPNTVAVVEPQILVGGQPATNVLAVRPAGSRAGDYFVSFNIPLNLSPGIYSIVITTGGFTSNTGLIKIAIAGLGVSQTGFTFQAVQNGAAPAAQILNLLSGYSGSLSYTISASTLPVGGTWLSVTPTSGTISSASPVPIAIQVNPTGLAPGDYYGLLRIDAPAAPNSPQLVTVVLNVNATAADPGPTLTPSGLAFVAVQGATFLTPQTVQITVVANVTEAFTAAITGAGAKNPFTVTPTAGSVAPGKPTTVSVQADPTALTSGVYHSTLTVTFSRTGVTRTADLLLIVAPALNPLRPDTPDAGPAAGSPCTPSQVLLVSTALANNFGIAAGWPTPLEVYAVDDCGTPMHSGAVTASFSNSDPSVSMQPLIDGRWTGTWASRDASNPNVKITFSATQPDTNLHGSLTVTGTLQPNNLVPILNLGGMVSSASFNGAAAPSTGEIVSIFGSNLAGGTAVASGFPLATIMQSVQLSLAGRALPLISVSQNQVNAVVPYNLTPGATYQLVAQRDNRLSVPIAVSIAAADPAIFTTDLSGKGQGHIYVTPTSTSQVLAAPVSPATTGDYLILYCSGLGATEPPSTSGLPAPFDSLRPTAAGVGLTIGGVSATVLFSGLTPGFSGLYQVNARMPAGVAPGTAVQVILTVAGISSPPVTMAVQ